MKINIITLLPDIFSSYLDASILGRAKKASLWDYNLINLRDFANDKHSTVDDTPAGGGAGMVLMCQPIADAIDSIKQRGRVIYLSPRGKVFNQQMAQKLACEDNITFLCGRYEGVDERVIQHYDIEEISIGDYVLTGGELPALTVIDSVLRHVPNVLGNKKSLEDESFASNLLEYPLYTRPREWRGMEIPATLLSGNHQNIRVWQEAQSKKITQDRRPDLLEKGKRNE